VFAAVTLAIISAVTTVVSHVSRLVKEVGTILNIPFFIVNLCKSGVINDATSQGDYCIHS